MPTGFVLVAPGIGREARRMGYGACVARQEGRWGGWRRRGTRSMEKWRMVQAPEQEKKTVEDTGGDGETKREIVGSGKRKKSKGLRGIGRTVPFLMLNAVTVLWGSQHAVIKLAVGAEGVSPEVLNLLRFFVGASLLTPFLLRGNGEKLDQVQDSEDWSALLAGAELGLWMFVGYALQSLGMLTTTAGKSAFLLYLNVKLVPIFSATFYNRSIELMTWISAGIAVVGTALLCFDGGQSPAPGDFLSIAAAAASAMFIIRLEDAAKKHSATKISVYSLWTTVLLCGGWVLGSEHPQSFQDILPSPEQLPGVLYLGVITTALTTVFQTVGQRFVRAEKVPQPRQTHRHGEQYRREERYLTRPETDILSHMRTDAEPTVRPLLTLSISFGTLLKAALIYAMDPVYAAVFSYILIGEKLGQQGIVGALFITIAALINQSEVTKFVKKLLSKEMA